MRANPAILTPESSGISECLDRLAAEKSTARPISTYRLQFHAGFRFENARRLAGYLHALGVSHVYSSPILKARDGSPHGYDITDHNQLNPEVGSYEELQDLVRELKNYGMGQVLDFVPNHMGIGPGTNPWWSDVLANGRASEFAEFFDLDWNPLKPELHNKLLLPVLGDQYGDVLEQGQLQVRNKDGELVIQYFDHDFPIDPQTLPLIFEGLGALSELHDKADEDLHKLAEMIEQLRALAQHSSTDPEQAKERTRIWERLRPRWQSLLQESGAVKELLDRALRHINGTPGDSRSFDLLHLLLELQVYRLAHWRVSGEEINYRRFFDINDLVGLSMENPRVFAATHRMLRLLLAKGMISGLRIDHCDGMLNPRQYLIRLQMLFAVARLHGEKPVPPLAENGISLDVQQVFSQHDWMYRKHPLYAVVEKILEPGEELPEEWPVDGTSGYDFTNQLNGLFIDQSNERAFDRIYLRFVDQVADVDALIYQSK